VFRYNLNYCIQVISEIVGSASLRKEGAKSLPTELMRVVLSILHLVMLAEKKNYRPAEVSTMRRLVQTCSCC